MARDLLHPPLVANFLSQQGRAEQRGQTNMKYASYYLKFVFAALLAGIVASAGRAQEPKPPNPSDKIQIDARGPIHEAFAKPYHAGAAPNEPVEKKPPDPIPEEPAAEKPQGKN